MKNVMILITGLPGSGKSFVASAIKKHFHARVFETGDVIREEIKRRGWKYTPRTDAKVRDWFHSGREHMIVERIWKKVKNKKGLVVVVGLRSLGELYMLKRLYKGKVILLKTVSPFRIRAQREIERGRFGRLESIKYLRERDRSELKSLVGLRSLLKRADYTINNSNLTKKQTEKKVVGLVRSIKR
jgi:dephospho-CoA kinase